MQAAANDKVSKKEGESDSDDSSSYKSPEIDSDELAALGDDDLV